MKTLALAAAFAVVSSAALAADLPTKAPVTTQYVVPAATAPAWAGFYVGVNAGYGTSTGDQTIAGADPNGVTAVNLGLVPPGLNTHGGGALLGATVGYNYMLNDRVLLGGEADFDWSGLSGSDGQQISFGPLALDTEGTSKLRWLGTLRGRAGYLITPTTLLYGTGGLAFGSVESSTAVTLAAPKPFGAQASADSSSTKLGWTIGAGVEQQLASRWSVKAEYQFVDLGSIDNSFGAKIGGAIPVNFASHEDLRYHTFRVGLNYHF